MKDNKKAKLVSQYMLDFIEAAPTAFHVIDQAFELAYRSSGRKLEILHETEPEWDVKPGGIYFVERNSSSAAFFQIPDKPLDTPRFKIAAVHTDSPSFKLKNDPEIFDNGYVRLNVEGYGGMIKESWFDRPLSIAGRVFVNDEGHIREELVDLRGCLVTMIPSLAIHMGKQGDDKNKISIQREMLPVIGTCPGKSEKSVLWPLVEKQLGCRDEDILSYDLFLYVLDEGRMWGAGEEFVASPRLDDQACVYAAIRAFSHFSEKRENSIPVLLLFDNEEVGSGSKQGADSTFASDVLERIAIALDLDRAGYMAAIADSFLVSADNAHAAHPAHMDRADIINRPRLNEGIVLKYAANQRYCTDALSAATFNALCREHDIPFQVFHNNGDVAGGSTLGNIVLSHASIPAVDIGIPQFAMHSACECCGVEDVLEMERFFQAYFA